MFCGWGNISEGWRVLFILYVRVCSIQKENNWDKLVLFRIAVAGFFYSEEENNWGKLGLILIAVA